MPKKIILELTEAEAGALNFACESCDDPQDARTSAALHRAQTKLRDARSGKRPSHASEKE